MKKEIEIEYLNSIEEDNLQKATESGQQYIKKEYEILEGEVREVDPEEWIKFRENPFDYSESVQRKYFGVSAKDWQFPVWVNPNEEWFEIPNGKFLTSYIANNPYTKESKEIYIFEDIYKAPPLSKKEIGDNIIAKVFDGNPYAQLVDMTKGQVTTLKLLVPILWKENIKIEYAELIATLEKISNARVENWLSWFDLSFLE